VFSRLQISRLVALANPALNGETVIVAPEVATENAVDGVDYHFHIKHKSKMKSDQRIWNIFAKIFWILFQ
jgi:uncharacterized protein YifN (PemK superfamily)